MVNKKIARMPKELHSKARLLLQQYVTQYESAVLELARTLAHQKNDDAILRSHIEAAVKSLPDKRPKHFRAKQILTAMGGAFFGAFVQGFVTELSLGRTPFIAIYTIIGFVGICMIFIGCQS